MLNGESQSNNHSKPTHLHWSSEAERPFLTAGVLVSLLAILLALVLGIFNSTGSQIWSVLVQFIVSSIVLGFTVWNYMQGLENQTSETKWNQGAILCAVLVVLAALFTGPYFTIMLAPLLVGLAQHRDDQIKIFQLGLVAVGLIAVELLIFYGLGFQRFSVDGAGTTLTAIAALTLGLASFMRSYQGQVKEYRDAAANKASEMEVAHEIQTSLMPPGKFTSGNWTLSARSLPALDVGGDFYEYVQHPHLEHTISGIAIGDVAGKGIPAALQMAVVRTLFRVEARRRIFPGETLMSVNMALQAERSFGMVTMLYAFIDIASNTLHVANAGHNYPLVLNETLTEIRLPGLPLGIDDSIEYEEKTIKITPGTSIIFYTDGVPEAMNVDGELFTFERFKEAVQANKDLDPDAMVEKMLQEIAIFTEGAAQSDDITIVVLQYHPQEAELASITDTAEPVAVTVEAGNLHTAEPNDDDDGINWI